MKKNQNFEIVSGDTVKLTISVDTDMPNLSDLVFTFAIAKINGDIVVTKSDTITSDGLLLTIPITPPDTANLQGSYRHELQAKDLAGNVYTMMVGMVTILKDLIE